MPVCSTQAGVPAEVPAEVPAGPLNHKQLQNNNCLGHKKKLHTFNTFGFLIFVAQELLSSYSLYTSYRNTKDY